MAGIRYGAVPSSDGFRDRTDAGRVLAARLRGSYGGRDDVLVVGLPRGGVPVAAEVAVALGAPLDVLVVRKLGVPGHHELAMGAIASGGAQVRNEQIVARLGISEADIERVVAAERSELQRRERFYRGDRPPLDTTGRVVIVVDDGLATGASMRSAVRALRWLGTATVVVAVPVGSPETCRELERAADVVCAEMPTGFHAVGQWYDDFRQTTDDEVRRLLLRDQGGQATSNPPR